MTRSSACFLLATLVVALAGCQANKSSTPLSPSVAGPIAGVTITAPKPLEPDAAAIPAQSQPVTLLFENASTSGQRPLTYVIELAIDAEFGSKVWSRESVPPGEGGRTALRLSDALASERIYYWRARAQDGANVGPYSAAARFEIITPVALGQPVLASPVDNVQLDTVRPRFTIRNASRSGPVGAVSYLIEVSSSEAFAPNIPWIVAEQAVQTSLDAPVALPYSARLFWRARAFDSTTSGPWSANQSFRTPAPAPSEPPPGGGGGGGKHVPPGPFTEREAELVVRATGAEFPDLQRIFPTTGQAEAAAEELMLRMIWHLQLYGFKAGRQQNPSGAISKDKLTINIGGSWHSYDICSLGMAGKPTSVHFLEVWPANHVPHGGIAD